MNEHPACVTRGDGTADDGGTDSFWRDFATRVTHAGVEDARGERGKSRTRERIMNRLFISSSSVKLLRMVRAHERPDSFFIVALYISRVSRVMITRVFRCCYNPCSRLQLSRSCLS